MNFLYYISLALYLLCSSINAQATEWIDTHAVEEWRITPAAFASFQVNGGGIIVPTGFGGGPNLRAQNIFGAPITVTPDQYYIPGTGNPAVSTADYYWVNGSIEQRPYDLAKSECGNVGATRTAAGQRYAWIMTPNHEGQGNTGDVDGVDIYLGFSNDPAIMPQLVTPIYRAQNANLPLAPGATFTGTISGNVLTVISITSGIVSQLSTLSGSGVTAGAFINGSGSGTGGTGTYLLNPGSANVATPTAMTTQQVNSTVAYFSYFVCNPDDTTNPFYLYIQAGPTSAGFQEGVIKSADLSNWIYQETPFRNYDNSGIVRNMQVARTGINTWVGWGPTLQFFQTGNQFGNGIWNSTDGKFFSFSGTFSNQCLPVYNPGGGFGPFYCPDNSSDFYFAGAINDGLTFNVGTQAFMAGAEAANTVGQSNTTGQYLARVPVDGNFNVLASPAYVRISNQYGGVFPGPTYVISVGNYVEDGIAHYFVTHGNYECLQTGGCDPAIQNKYAAVVLTTSLGTTASGSGTTAVLHMNSVAGLFNGMSIATRTNASVAFGSTIQSISGNDVTILGPLNNSPPPTNFPPIPTISVSIGDSFLFYSSGLRQEFVDHYTEIVDATAAAGAAPIGVTASAAAGVAKITCYDVLPTSNYRLYRGFSAQSQLTLVGDFIGCSSITDQPFLQTPQVIFYKLVYINNNIEQKSRVVSTYVSSSTALVNKHLTRALANGADPATIDRVWLDAVDAWLVSNNLEKNLQQWESPSFGVVQDINGVVSRAFDFGTTRLPRGGDYEPVDIVTHTIKYNPTGLGNNVPALIATDTASFGVFGNGRINNIRRKVQITACASYSKPSTGVATLLSFGSFSELGIGLVLQHTSGSPGNVSFSLGDDTITQRTVTSAASSATGSHVACGTFNTIGATTANSPGTLTAYADGIAGTPDNNLHSNIDMSLNTTLSGQAVQFGISNLAPFLATGSTNNKASPPAINAGPANPYGYVFEANEANFSSGDLIIFDIALTSAQITSLNTLLATRIAPVVAQAYNITNAPFNATCNGTVDDSSAFTTWNTTAVTWDAANPNVTGVIQLTIPNSRCMFLQGGSGIAVTKGIINHTVRIVGAGTSSEWSDGGIGGGWFLGSSGENFSGTSQATVQTVAKGSTNVTLTACPGAGCSATLALFTVGQYARVSGIAMQSSGNPTNPAFWDYILVSGKTTTDIQFTTTPLTHDYKSTWPSYGTPYYGGPATIYALDPTWPITLEINNLILSLTNTGSDGEVAVGKNIVFKNVTINTDTGGATCEVPSQNMTYSLINVTAPNCHYEIDKIIDFLKFQNVSVKSIDYQSASVKQMLVSETTSTGFVNTGINSIIYSSTIANYQPGSHSFGGSFGITQMFNNSVAAFAPSAASCSTPGSVGSWSGGVYTIANSDIPSVCGGEPELLWGVPGLNIYWGGNGQGPVIQVKDIATSGTNTIVTTSLTSGFPVMPNASTVPAITHSAPQYFGSGNTGVALATVDLNPPLAYQGLPLGSYWTGTITSSNGNPSSPLTPYVFGLLIETDWKITSACSGISIFEWVPVNPVQILGSSSTSVWAPIANALIASATPRQIFPTTTAGAKSGDVLTSPGANAWLFSNQNEPAYGTVANCGAASTTVTIQTNQGVISP